MLSLLQKASLLETTKSPGLADEDQETGCHGGEESTHGPWLTDLHTSSPRDVARGGTWSLGTPAALPTSQNDTRGSKRTPHAGRHMNVRLQTKGGPLLSLSRGGKTLFLRSISCVSKTDVRLAGNEGMDPIESLLGAHSLIPY